MSSGSWIRPITENLARKVVADPEGNRWEWHSHEETARLLEKLNNDELSIEKTNLHPLHRGGGLQSGGATRAAPAGVTPVPPARQRPKPASPIKAAASLPTIIPGNQNAADRRKANGARNRRLRAPFQ
jgi:hypothetical protein